LPAQVVTVYWVQTQKRGLPFAGRPLFFCLYL